MKVRGGFLISLKSDKAYHTLSGSHTPDPLCLAAEKHMHHTKKEREELAERKKIGRLELFVMCPPPPPFPQTNPGSGAVEVVLSSLV